MQVIAGAGGSRGASWAASELRHRQRRRLPLGQGWNRRFEAADSVREFRWAKGGEGFAGLYYSVTVGAHVGYNSWLERIG
ncbi:hypothetical protein [Streptomyces sp. OfavH-34-F]|uniref:hypothetical protein n=1 Tax=Streptomyces sp. OfavH-34-F TaxID=2917760 RepID=UPI0027E5A0B4|nr:hypothetical protein [Streptomyces sp. OfavH-34-F]